MNRRRDCTPDPVGGCSLCGDEAVQVRVVEVDVGTDTARVEGAVSVERVALDLVEDVRVGDRLMVHMGFAIGRVTDAGRARER